MGIGYLTVQVHTGDGALPVAGAYVIIRLPNGATLFETNTDANGNTDYYPLSAPDVQYTLDPYYMRPAYSTYDVDVSARGYVTSHIHGVEIVDTQTSILPVDMLPLVDEPNPTTDIDIDIPPVGLLIPTQNRQVGYPTANTPSVRQALMPRVPNAWSDQTNPVQITEVAFSPSNPFNTVFIPEYITVHLGIPTNSAASNVRVKFVDYIKNVVSSEIYSTWPNNSLIANVHVIVTFALNRVFTEWYPSRGFNFDITNSTSYDQFYRVGAQIFDNISKIVDEIFNVYARRFGFVDPFFTQFCNGTTSTCNGLSQWGTVTLANQGLTPLQILHYYYPNDLELVASNNIMGITESYPGSPLSVGSQGPDVLRMQLYLNRIRVNFPLIPQISNPNGVFGTDTQDAVRTFQRTFDLTADGIIGRSTWNKISFIFVGVTRLAELDSEGIRISIGQTPPNVVLSQGSRGADVIELQFILNYISPYYQTIPTVIQDGVFGASTKNAVIEFQKTFDLTPDGVVGPATWDKLYAVYRGIDENVQIPEPEVPSPEVPSPEIPPSTAPPFPGTLLRVGSTGPDVRLMQTYLNTIRIIYPSIPYHEVNGVFDEAMRNSVVAFQQQFLLTPDGIIGPMTWNKIVSEYQLALGNTSVSLDYPGTPLRLGSTGSDVRLMQGFLNELRQPYPSLPPLMADGIFGPQTQSAVTDFQRIVGLAPDGIIGPITWYTIINQRNQSVNGTL